MLGNGLKPTASKSGELTCPWIDTNLEVLSDLKSNQSTGEGLLIVLVKINYVQSRDFIHFFTLFSLQLVVFEVNCSEGRFQANIAKIVMEF